MFFIYKRVACLFLFLFFAIVNAFGAARTASASGSWTNTATWGGAAVPTSADDVTINQSVTVTVDVSNAVCLSLKLNNNAAGTAVIQFNSGSKLTVSGAVTTSGNAGGRNGTLTMTSGGTLTCTGFTLGSGTNTFNYGTGTVELTATNTLPASSYTTFYNLTLSGGTTTLGTAISIAGSFQNNAALTTGANRITFSGSGNATISGSATTTFSGGITMSKGSSTDVVEATGVIAMVPTGTVNQAVFTQGVFKISSASTITPFFSNSNSSPYDIATNATLWINNSSATINSTTSWSIDGTIHASAGTINVGSATDHYLAPYSNTSIIIDGGTLNAPSRLSQSGSTWTYSMTAGTLTVGNYSTSTSRPTFNMDAAGCTFFMSGGTIIIKRPAGNAGSYQGFKNIAGTSTFSGGTLQMGDATTPASTIMQLETINPIYNLTVNSSNLILYPGTTTYSTTTISNDVNVTTGKISFDNSYTVTVAGNCSIASGATVDENGASSSGKNIKLTGNNKTLTNNGTFTIGTLQIQPGSSNTYTIAGTSGITVDNNLDNLSTGASTYNANTGTVTVSGNLTGGSATTSFYNQTNAYLKTPGTVMSTGKLYANYTGNTVEYSGAAQTIVAPQDNYMNLICSGSNTKTLGGNTNVNGVLTVRGGVTLANGGYTLSSPTSVVLENGGSGATISGSGVLTLGGDVTVNKIASTGTGATISCPVALGSSSRTFTVADETTGAIDLTISGVISGTVGIAKATTSSILKLTGANTYTGTTTVSAGTLQLGAAGVIPDVSAVTVNGTLDMNTYSETIGSLAGAGTVDNIAGAGTPTLTCGGDNTSTIFSGVLKNTTGSLNVVKTGTGAFTLSGASANTHSGGVMISTGTLNINKATALGATAGTFIIASGATINNTSGGAITVSNNNPQTWNGDYTFTGSNALNMGAGTVNMAANAQVSVSSSTLTIGGVISGSTLLSKAGAGVLTLSGTNTYSGGTILNTGTLDLNNVAALGASASTFTVTGGTINNSSGVSISLTNNNPIILNGDFTFTGSNDLNMGTGIVTMGANIQITVSSSTLTIGGINNNPTRNLTKAGNGTLAFGSNNVTLNTLTISAGTLKSTSGTLTLKGNYAYSAGTFIHNNGTVVFNGSSAQTLGTTGTQSFYNLILNNSGGSTLTLNAPISVANTLSLSAGYLVSTSTNSVIVTNTSGSAVNGGSATSYVKGPITWSVTAGQTYTFPTGKGSKWRRVGLSSVSAAGAFTCEYFNQAYTNIGTVDLSTTVTPTLTTLSGIEYWDANRTSGSANAAVTLYWEDAWVSGIRAPNNFDPCRSLRVAHFNSGTGKWENMGITATSGSCFGNNSGSITGSVQSSFSPETFGGADNNYNVNPLPIELLYFDAAYNGNSVEVKWSTASEINNNYFTIERSTDGVNFYMVTVVSSLAQGGNSTSVLSYTYDDVYNTPGTYYYRIKQTDFDGQYQYSPVKTVVISDGFDFTFEIAPNPNNGEQITMVVNSHKNETIKLIITDVLGQTVGNFKFVTTHDGYSSFPLNIADKLKAGCYFYTAISDSTVAPVNKQVIVQ